MVDANHVVNILGKHSEDPLVLDALRMMGLVLVVPRPKRGDSYVHMENENGNFGIEFKTASSMKIENPLFKEGTLIVANIYYINKYINTQDVAIMHAFDLSFYNNRKEVLNKLGNPNWSINDGIKRDQWNFEKYKLMLDYENDTDKIKMIIYRHNILKP